MTLSASLPPGPRGHFLMGHLKEFRQDILGFYTRLFRDHGECAGFCIGRRRLALLSHPDWIERVLVTDHHKFSKLTYVLRLLLPLLGEGLLTSEGAFWLRQRRLIQPAFSRQRIAGYTPFMTAYTLRMLEGWQDGSVRDIHADMKRLALEIVAKALFDADVGGDAAEVGAALIDVMYSFLARWGSLVPLPEWVPTAVNRRYHRSIRRLDRIIYRFIAERRASKEEKNDLLSLLLRARDEDDGTRMTDRQLRDEVMTLFLAGHETTAVAMSFTWYLLAQHPEVEVKALEELRKVLSGRPPTVEDLPRLPYTEAVILESMRLYPPAYAFGRLALAGFDVGDYHIAAGTTVLVSQWIMHRHPRYWDDPEAFRPERWLDGLAKQLPKFVYFPFGGGQRQCIGNTFAMIETVLLLATMLPRVHVELVAEHVVKVRPAVTLVPEHGIKVVVRKR
jgi:cytochrome P450